MWVVHEPESVADFEDGFHMQLGTFLSSIADEAVAVMVESDNFVLPDHSKISINLAASDIADESVRRMKLFILTFVDITQLMWCYPETVPLRR